MDFWTSSHRLLGDFFEKSKTNNRKGSASQEAKHIQTQRDTMTLWANAVGKVNNKNSRLTLFTQMSHFYTP